MQKAMRASPASVSLRALLMVGAAAALIIVGLLAMHTFAGETAGHGAAGIAHSGSATMVEEGSEPASSFGGSSISCDGPCTVTEGQGHGHTDMVTACALALLAGLLLLLPPALAQRDGSLQHPLTFWQRIATGVISNAPSLTFLSISRT